MLRKLGIVLIAVLAMTALVFAERVTSKIARTDVPRLTGSEAIDASRAVSPSERPVNPSLDDPIGPTFQAGTTWYSYQHNGTAGKMIAVDEGGFVHMVWMNGLNAQQNPRHVYYNIWDPNSQTYTLGASGAQINSSNRGGYICQVTHPSGFCFPAFHEIIPSAPDSNHSVSAIDFLARTGAFTSAQPAWLNGRQYIWPKITQTPDSVLHMVSTAAAIAGGDPQTIQYSRGIPVFDADGFGTTIDWQVVSGGSDRYRFVDSCMTIAVDVAASRHTNRVAIAWAHNRDNFTTQIDNDLYIMISEDGGSNWGPRTNITNFVPGDFNCASGDTMVCNNDTLRLYTDCSVIIDDNDIIHVAFAVRTWFDVGHTGPDGFVGPSGWISQSGIFHWDEEVEVFSPVANAYHFQTVEGGTLIDNGAWQLNVHRPSLSEDTTNGYLYCSYQRYDSTQYSDLGYPMGDAWVTVSTDEGVTWSQAVNVTRTDGGQNTPAPGSLSERDITLSRYVSGDYLHMSYILDHDAGAEIQTPAEGVATLNPVYYQRIPVDSIPAAPLLSNEWPVLHADSTGWPGFLVGVGDIPAVLPNTFALHQNYPNPFNPSTSIQFDLARTASVTLKVFNVRGQEVATLVGNRPMNAGVQVVEFDGADLASGVYIYRINVDGVTASKKMVLMK